MDNLHLENIWFRSVIDNSTYIDTVEVGFFSNDSYKEVFKVVKSFWKKYQKIPTKNQVKESAKLLMIHDILTNDIVESLWSTNLEDYDNEWLQENTEAWIEWKTLEKSAVDSVNYIKRTQVTPDNIKDVINTYKSIVVDRNKIDFSFDIGLNFNDPENHKQYQNRTFSSGYDYIDHCLGGGFSSRCLYVFLGQPKVGKTLWMGNIAAQGVKASSNVAVVTLELGDRKYIKRMGSNLLGIKMGNYQESAENDDLLKRKITNLGFDNLTTPGQLYIKEFPTSQASVIDVENWLTKVEQIKGFKFKIIVIDYINIMKNWRNPNSENTYMKIKQIAEDLRAMAQRNEWAIVTATQTKQSEFDATDLSMNSASESSGLVATVDGMFGIIQDPIMYTNNEYKLKLLANRDEGYKNSYKKFLVDYGYMRINEDPNSEIMNE
jgi:KaiC/GvpD/RAD55 family RecA-like ATPase